MEFSKSAVHANNISVYQKMAKLGQLPDDGEYWTLMHPDSDELETLDSKKFLKRHQFHGVNDDHDLYQKCLKNWPEIERQSHLDDWIWVVSTHIICPRGGLVHLDTMTEYDRVRPGASTMTVATLRNCGPNTLVAANFCYSRPLHGHDEIGLRRFVERVNEYSTGKERARFEYLAGNELLYVSHSTEMLLLYFWVKDQ